MDARIGAAVSTLTQTFTHRITAIRAISLPRWLTYPLFAFLVTRLIVLGGGYIAEIAMPSPDGPEFWHPMPQNLLMDITARWDSGFYMNVAQSGYFYTPGQQSSVAFFPVYPLLMNLVMPFYGGNAVIAGAVVSHVCLLVALIFLYLLTELEFGAAAAQRTVFYLAVFPTAFFFSMVYTESVFLLFSVATFYFARRHMWAWAAVMGAITSASRIVGVVVWACVMLEWLRLHNWTLFRIHKREAWAGLWNGLRRDLFSLILIMCIPLGLISYMVFLYTRFGDPIAFWTAQSAWGRGTRGLFGSIFRDLNGLLSQNWGTGEIWWNSLLNLIGLFVTLAMVPFIWRRLGASFALHTLLGVLIPAASGTGSLIRYMVVLFPMFMMFGLWGKREWVDRVLMVFFCVFLGICTTIFVNWIFLA
jgi:hypothetical protein